MSEKVPITLLDGEELLHNESPAIVAYFATNPLLSIISFGILPFMYSMQSSFVATNERVVMKKGILRTSSKEYRIEDIKQLNTAQSLFEKLLGCRGINLSTAATGSGDISFAGLKDYESVANTIRNQMR
jgi:uncharacterized membrane protein YdbT with pleckstrin-like domain